MRLHASAFAGCRLLAVECDIQLLALRSVEDCDKQAATRTRTFLWQAARILSVRVSSNSEYTSGNHVGFTAKYWWLCAHTVHVALGDVTRLLHRNPTLISRDGAASSLLKCATSACVHIFRTRTVFVQDGSPEPF